MTEFDRFAHALALTESHDNPNSSGDSGLAYGRWQMHPAFIDQWWPDDISVETSWDDLFRAALKRFYDTRFQPGRTLQQVVMEFHLGVRAVAEGKNDAKYAARFDGFYDVQAVQT